MSVVPRPQRRTPSEARRNGSLAQTCPSVGDHVHVAGEDVARPVARPDRREEVGPVAFGPGDHRALDPVARELRAAPGRRSPHWGFPAATGSPRDRRGWTRSRPSCVGPPSLRGSDRDYRRCRRRSCQSASQTRNSLRGHRQERRHLRPKSPECGHRNREPPMTLSFDPGRSRRRPPLHRRAQRGRLALRRPRTSRLCAGATSSRRRNGERHSHRWPRAHIAPRHAWTSARTSPRGLSPTVARAC